MNGDGQSFLDYLNTAYPKKVEKAEKADQGVSLLDELNKKYPAKQEEQPLSPSGFPSKKIGRFNVEQVEPEYMELMPGLSMTPKKRLEQLGNFNAGNMVKNIIPSAKGLMGSMTQGFPRYQQVQRTPEGGLEEVPKVPGTDQPTETNLLKKAVEFVPIEILKQFTADPFKTIEENPAAIAMFGLPVVMKKFQSFKGKVSDAKLNKAMAEAVKNDAKLKSQQAPIESIKGAVEAISQQREPVSPIAPQMESLNKSIGEIVNPTSTLPPVPEQGIISPVDTLNAKAAPKTVRGIYYFKTRELAKAWAEENGWPTDRIIDYEKGLAVQSGASGNYAGPGKKPAEWRGTEPGGGGGEIRGLSVEWVDDQGKPVRMGLEDGHPLWNPINLSLKSWQGKGTREQLLSHLQRTNGAMADAKEIGMMEWLKDKPKVTAQEVRDYVNSNKIQIREVTKSEGGSINDPGDHGMDTKFGEYQLPGGENYRELLLTLPDKRIAELNRKYHEAKGRQSAVFDEAERRTGNNFDLSLEERLAIWEPYKGTSQQVGDAWRELMGAEKSAEFQSSHWDEPNVLAHVRFNDRVLPDGRKVLFLEELQSDWHQKGRTQGYGPSPKVAALTKKIRDLGIEKNVREISAKDVINAGGSNELVTEWFDMVHSGGLSAGEMGIPDAPLKDSGWKKLAMKRMTEYAQENGYDSIGWTTGEQQAARYDLSKHLDKVTIKRRANDESWVITGDKRGVGQVVGVDVTDLNKLGDYIGKDLAERAKSDLANVKNEFDGVTYSGLDLQIGGEWAKNLYDKELPSIASDIGKRYGAKVGMAEIPTVESYGSGERPTETPVGMVMEPIHVMDLPKTGKPTVGSGLEAKGLAIQYLDDNGKPITYSDFLRSRNPKTPQPISDTTKSVDPLVPVISQPKPGEQLVIAKQDSPRSMPIYENEISPFMTKQIPDLRVGLTDRGNVVKLLGENPSRVFEKVPVLHDLFFKGYNLAMKDFVTRQVETKGTAKNWRLTPGVFNDTGVRIGTYLTSKETGGLKLLESMGVKIPELTPTELGIAEQMRGKYETYFKEINTARELMGQKPLEYTENYFTWIRNFADMNDMGMSPALTESPVLNNHLKDIKFKFAKRRDPRSNAPIELDAFNVFQTYASNANKVISHAPVIAKGRGLVEPFEITEKGVPKQWQMRDTHPEWSTYIMEYIDAVGGRSKGSLNPYINRMNRYLQTALTKNIAVATLAFNVRTVAIQPTSIRLAYVELGEKFMAQGLAENALSPERRAWARKNSNTLSARTMDYNVGQIMDRTIGGKWAKAKEVFGRMGTAPMRWVDYEMAQSTFLGAYAKGIKGLKLDHLKAIDYADKVVIDTQASGLPGHVSPLQRSPVGKVASVFQTFTINEWNQLQKILKGEGLTPKGRITALARLGIATMLTNALFEGVFKMRSPYPAPEWELKRLLESGEDSPAKIASTMALEMTEQIPIIGGALRWASPNRVPLPASAQVPVDIMTTIGTAMKQGDLTPLYSRRSIEAIGKLLGIPGTGPVMKFIDRIKKGSSVMDAVVGIRAEYIKATKKSGYYAK